MTDQVNVVVPNLVGLDLSTAEKALKDAGLLIGNVESKKSDKTPTGCVSNSDPTAETQVAAGSVINLELSGEPPQVPSSDIVSQPVAPVAVPDVLGLTQPAAEKTLRDTGLSLGRVALVKSDKTPTGAVSNSDPAAGIQVSRGSAVNLEVSSGASQTDTTIKTGSANASQPGTVVAIPDLVGLTQPIAEKALNDVGLSIGRVLLAESNKTPPGRVTNSDPPFGAPVALGAAVNLEVSRGASQVVPTNDGAAMRSAPSVAVPDVIGLTRPAAEAILKNIGLTVGPVKTRHSSSVPTGGVTATYPDASTVVSPSSSVELDLSSGPERDWIQYLPTALLAGLGVIVLGLIVYGITQKSQAFLTSLADKEVARGLITFVIAITTVGVAIILAISTLILTEGEAGDKRFDRGKQVLSVLIGVLGTIVGFYFGADTAGAKQSSPTEQVQPAGQITTSSLPDGTVNSPYPETTLTTTGLAPPLEWSVTPSLPKGLDLDQNGTVKGTPTAPFSRSSFAFTVHGRDKPSISVLKQLELEVK